MRIRLGGVSAALLLTITSQSTYLHASTGVRDAAGDTVALRQALERIVHEHRGITGVSVRNLATFEIGELDHHHTGGSALRVTTRHFDRCHGKLHIPPRKLGIFLGHFFRAELARVSAHPFPNRQRDEQ
jgi:hypothetical protein